MAQFPGRIGQTPPFQPHDPCLGQSADQAGIMRGEDDAGAEALHRGEQLKQAYGHARIDVAGRLVRDEEVGPRDDRARDGNALLFPAGQRRRARGAGPGQADPFDHVADRPGQVILACPREPQRQRDVVEHVEMRDQPEVLEHDADAAAQGGPLRSVERNGIVTEQRDGPARRFLREVKQLEQGSLARPARPGQEMELPRMQCKADVGENFASGAVPQADVFEPGDRQVVARRIGQGVGFSHRAQSCGRGAGISSADVFARADVDKPAPTGDSAGGRLVHYGEVMLNQLMLIACPACHTRYAVPEGAIGEGRTVRCAKCKHSWFQDSEGVSSAEPEIEPAVDPIADEAPAQQSAPIREPEPQRTPEPAMAAHDDHAHSHEYDEAPAAVPPPDTAAPVGDGPVVAARQDDHSDALVESEPYAEPVEDHAAEPDIEEQAQPDYYDEDAERETPSRRLWLYALVFALLIAAAAFALIRINGMPDWVPIENNEFAAAPSDLELDFPSNEQERRTMPDGQQFFATSGTITNVGEETRRVPPVLVILRDTQERIVYSWELDPPQRELAPGESLSIKEVVTDVPRSARIAEIGWKAS